jgi:PAS domain S-box-containing protein
MYRDSSSSAPMYYRPVMILLATATFITVIFIIFFLAFAGIQDRAYDRLRDHALLQNSFIADAVESSLDAVSALVLTVQELSTGTDLLQPDRSAKPAFEQMLKRLVLADDLLSAAFIIDSEGDQIYSTMRQAVLSPSLIENLVIAHQIQNLRYRLFMDQEQGRMVISTTISGTGDDESLLVVELERDSLFNRMRTIETQELNGVLLIDEDDTIVSSWLKEETPRSTTAALSTELMMSRINSVIDQYSTTDITGAIQIFEDEHCLLIAQQLQNNPFYVSTHYDKTAYITDIERLFDRNLLLLAALALVMIIISILLIRRITAAERLKTQLFADLEQQVSDRTKELEDKKVNLEQEIAVHRETERMLKEQEGQYRSLVEYSPDAIFLNFQDQVSLINQQGLELFGASEQGQLLGRSIFDLFPPAIHRQIRERIQYMRETGRPAAPAEEQIITIDGRIVDVEALAAPFSYRGESGIHVILRDITERKNQQLEKERLLQALEQSGEMVVMADPLGTITYVNQTFTHMTGYLQHDAPVLSSLLFEKEVDQPCPAVERLLVHGETFSGNLVIPTRSGELLTVHAALSPVLGAGEEMVNIIAVLRDITSELLIEEQHRQAQKLESIGQLAGGVAHDFNNMLGVIIGYADLALLVTDEQEPLHQHLTEILKAAKRSSLLTRQLLAFARKETIAPVPIDLNESIEDLRAMIRSLIKDDIELLWSPGDQLHMIHADPGQMDQVIINLMLNARDAIPGVGKITVETASIHVDRTYAADHMDARAGDYVRLTVSDNGIGMTQKILSKIFDPFYTTKGTGEGTGLGLSMIYGVVQQNNGFINVYSEPGSGTSVKIYLPAIMREEQTAHTQPQIQIEQHERQLAELTILLVEDDPVLLKLNTTLLSRFGCSVLSTESPREALELVEGHEGTIDLLITDVIMPQMDGRTLSKKVLEQQPAIRCLFVSGYTANVIAHHGILDEGIHFLQKPFSSAQLASAIRSMLKLEQAID